MFNVNITGYIISNKGDQKARLEMQLTINN